MTRTDPLSGKLVTLFGGSGWVGIHVAQDLLKRGARLKIASRHPEKARDLRPMANLGQVAMVRCDVTRSESVRAAMTGSDLVVNLVGTFEGDLGAVMADGAQNIAKAAAEEGVQALVHVSAIGADIEGDTAYAVTKAEGEEAVRDAFPKATIMRPSIIFGEDGEFINMMAGLIQRLPVLPVFAPDSELQLVWVDDVAAAIVAALGDPSKHGGKTYELGGPERVPMLALNRRIAEQQGRKRHFIPLPDSVSGGIAAATGWMPGAPITQQQWKLLEKGSTVSGDYPGFDKLGITPKPLDVFLERWMVRYRKHGRFGVKPV
ncbi:complex I NDUFA9 subunit family protein [Pseudoblastomonas halimionae]|uniref:NAD(P)H-binding protein n=1 Tax=Alteriqipengyuania halimionae TaxID=1926630 RepID=A0A6I4U7C4_9SPHN|nr:complex I NDUFA9 subunit family protein [Alteriqipengyuania halimionae]MXP10271.1 NAD(P)H-binding protein [Alteriqipengyuania halimionae]